MIIVNTPGSGATAFAPLEHAVWHGFTPTDLVFPSFLFAVGNAMSFSMDKYKLMGDKAFLTKVFKRTVILFMLGFLMYWFPFISFENGHIVGAPFSHTRVMGVLQRIALCYLFASLLIHYFSRRNVILTGIGLLVGYWLILVLSGDAAQPYSMLGNAGQYLDKFLLGNNHLYHGEGLPFDPEGILSTMPAIGNVLIGYYAGDFIKRSGKTFDTIARLMLVGVLLVFIALCWDMVFPINKKLWTSPFVLLTTGIDLLLLSSLIYIVEIAKKNALNWTKFFLVLGKNPLTIYLLSEILAITFNIIPVHGESLYAWINNVVFQKVAPGPVGSLLFAICFMLLCWSVGSWIDKRQHHKRAQLLPDRVTA